MNDYFMLMFGIACAGLGGELFVRGVVGLAQWWRIPPGIIGATIAAFATSSPELSVSINAAMAGKPEIALGDALGSNVVNIALILGIALTIAGIQGSRDSIKRHFPVVILVPVITGLFFLDGALSRLEGLLMLAVFFTWIVMVIVEAKKQRNSAGAVLGETQRRLVIVFCVSGLTFLVIAGNLIVTSANDIAVSYGVDAFIIGATIVAIGTSVPELATTIIARLRGHDEVGLGTILGSNIFNGLFIVSIAAIIHPIVVNPRELASTLVVGLVAVLLVFPSSTGFVERRRGFMLLALFAIYVVILFQFQEP